MKILIVGGGGYVGSRLVPKLLERKYHVGVIDTFMFGNHLPDQVVTTQKDVFDITHEDFVSYDCVIFLAGLSNDPMAEYDPAQNFVSNAAGPAYVTYMASKAGVKRCIYASSCSVYGFTKDEVYDETNATVTNFPYGVSKLQGEKGVLHFERDDFSVIVLRKGTISGHSPRMRFDLIANTMFKCAIREGTIHVSNPSIWRPILAIEDAVTAYIRAIEAHSSVSGIFNVASVNCTVGHVADCVKEKVESVLGKKVELDINNIDDFRNYKVSIEKSNNMLSFHPKCGIHDITSELCDNIDKYGDFSDINYYNIEVFKKWKKNK